MTKDNSENESSTSQGQSDTINDIATKWKAIIEDSDGNIDDLREQISKEKSEDTLLKVISDQMNATRSSNSSRSTWQYSTFI